jgi:CRP-like cAMP-binding protein
LGISREKINRQLKVWQRSGILSLKRSEVWIHDRARLAIAIDNDD